MIAPAPFRRTLSRRSLVLLAALAIGPLLRAQTTWQSGGSDANWSTASNWSDGLPANDGTASVVFSDSGSTTPTLDAAWSVHNLTFDASAQLYTLGVSSGLTIGAGGITDNQASGTETITAGMYFDSDATVPIDVTTGGTLAIQTAIGSGDITKTGGGTLQITGGSLGNYGTLYVNSGTVFLTSGGAHAFDNTTINLNGGTLNTTITTPFVGALEGSGNLALNKSSNGAAVTYSFGQNNRSTTYSGSMSGTGGVIKAGTGTMTLSGNSTYTGATKVNAGTLVVNGSAASSAFTINSGATLGGSGTVGALTVASGATLAPGNSPGTLTAGDTTFAGGGAFQFQVNDASGSAGANWDQLAVNGSLTLSATSGNPFTLDVTSLTLADAAGNAANFNSASDYSFTFLTTTGGVSGFSSDAFAIDTTHFTNPFTGTWSVSLTNSGHDLSVNYTGASAVPEPSTYAAFAGLAALGLATLRRRRLRSAQADAMGK
jgi:autotransporter-associated beta strand protein